MKPNIFEYSDYRQYLSDVYTYFKKTRPSFSYRYFSKKAGFSAPNFLKLVTEGKRSLTLKCIPKFAKALGINKQEAEFFRSLALFNQAKNSDEKTQYYQEMIKCRRFREINQLSKEVFRYYSNWYNIAIREMVNLPQFKEDPEWIASHVFPSIKPKQAQQALGLLLKLGMLKKDKKKKLVQSDPIVTTGPEVRSVAVANFHRSMLKLADKVLDDVPSLQRDISAVTIGVAKGQLPQIKNMIGQFRKELITTLRSSGGKPDEIYQLNIQLFPIVRKEQGSRK